MSKKDWQLLQAYRATGLSPEEVLGLQKELEWKQMCLDLAQRAQAQAEKERDAAIADIKHGTENCEVCRFVNTVSDCDAECLTCQKECMCRDCRDESHWQWRGWKEG